ncbi:uncharacterized protein LOC109815160 isoform X1 [Cajanus cajan]|uniref:uncharacterized protein LOC109815160 isoform X1 n=1 Tax=Cajanus cajan TaxID=3821 RepID=UPI0010FB7270|nr:uncharacterized protein LOC109815160 isoform X1 [Cajanus cajan]XP_029130565.1 uncharacterized protein LOC109815160 isoform X1 [Cajanus cajan]XP_029130566.1 uncharacterized protein LOC109815160 isoform X1 [Cajanus cajan]
MGQEVLVPVEVYMCDDACGEEPKSIKQIPSSGGNEDVEVNITGGSNLGKAFVVEDSCEDATEYSSSFDYTGSGAENVSSFSDAEVESRRCADDPSSSMCDDWYESCERREKRMPKSLTIHWRRFIRPIRWRCKWIELRMKQLQSQARKYEKELAAYNYTKQLDFAHLTIDDSNIKSVPRYGRMHRNNIMKRNRRKRVEEQCDQASYMSNHSLFSYYEKKDCTVDTCLKDFRDVGLGVNDSNEELKLNDEWSSIEYEHIDKSLDDIIQKIEAVQSQVQKLKTRTDTVLQSEFHLGDLLMPGNASASREGIIPFVETTNSPELNDQWEDIKDEVLVPNQAAREEWNDCKYDANRLLKRTNESIQEDKFILEVQVSEPAPPENLVNEHSTWMSCSTLMSNISTSKRKRRKKSGSS